jgi:hypothetical protein
MPPHRRRVMRPVQRSHLRVAGNRAAGATRSPGLLRRDRHLCAVAQSPIQKEKTATRRIEGRRLGVYWPQAGRQNGDPGYKRNLTPLEPPRPDLAIVLYSTSLPTPSRPRGYP